MKAQTFGGVWTEKKLDILDGYLKAYFNIMKQMRNEYGYKTVYIDAFSGSGSITTGENQVLTGSVLRALKFPFDKYYCIEKDTSYSEKLNENITTHFPEKSCIVSILNEDCNTFLEVIDEYKWAQNKWRGIIFLDPYAMDLSWESLKKINETKVFDIWYFFPYSALNRCLNSNGIIPESLKEKIAFLLGSTDWETRLYRENKQTCLFDDELYKLEKVGTDELCAYLVERFESIFPTVAPPHLFKNSKKSPLFLLCFLGLELSSQVQRFIKKDFMRSFPA